MSWLTRKDVKVGQVVKGGPYNGATVIKIHRNGWCRLKWSAKGEQFSVRVHWLTAKKDMPDMPREWQVRGPARH